MNDWAHFEFTYDVWIGRRTTCLSIATATNAFDGRGWICHGGQLIF